MGNERAETYLRLVPALAAPPETIEVVVTGASARIRAVVPIRGTAEMPDT